MKQEDKLPENIGLGVVAGILGAFVTFIVFAWILWLMPFPEKLPHFNENIKYWTALRINEIAPPLFNDMAGKYQFYINKMSTSSWPMPRVLNICAFIALLMGVYIAYLVGKPQSAVRQTGGRKLLEDTNAKDSLKLQARKECGKEDVGIKLHSSFEWNISRSRECQHMIIVGKSGSGKTQIIIPMISASIRRGDQLVIYDNKGDFSRWINGAIQIAPWHKDSMAIDIAKDCTNTQSARELAARLIPEGADPMWHQAARLILVAILIKLQKEKPGQWTWGDLYAHVCRSQQQLLLIVKEHTPEARHIIEAPGKTTQSILINFSTNMSLIADLAAAWGNTPEDKRISITEWIKNPPADKKILILQGSENYKELSNAYIHIVLDMMSSLINSPELPESTKRRIYFFIDEFTQLGKIDKFRALLEIGRSKGIRVVIAFQDISQLRDVYGEHVANAWLGIVGTYIVTQLGIGETANYISEKMVGYKTIDRVVMHQDKPSAPIRERVLVIEPHEFNENLGKSSKGIKALILGYKNAHIIEWPFSNIKNLRQAYIPAAWLNHPENKQSSNNEETSAIPEVDEQSVTSVISGEQNKKLKLRKLTRDEIVAMAESGTNISDSADPVDAMSSSSVGG